MNLGSYAIDRTLTFYVSTQRFDTGAGTDADSVPTYRIYENETGTPILTGSMALLDSSNTAGLYSEQITLSAANGFEYAKNYCIYIAVTVNSVAGTTLRFFQMGADVNTKLIDGVAPDDSATLVDAIWNEATTGHSTAGTFGKLAVDDDAKLDTIDNFIDTEVAAIKVVTDQMVFGTANRLNVQVYGVQADAITAASMASDVTAELQAGLATAAAVAALPTAATNAAGLLDLAAGVETGLTLRQHLRLSSAVLYGKASGLDTTNIVFRNPADNKSRVTVTQSASDRSAVTLDAS